MLMMNMIAVYFQSLY